MLNEFEKQPRSLIEIEGDLAFANARLELLKNDLIPDAKSKVAELEKERDSLHGGWRTNGRIGELEKELERAQRFEADKLLTSVVWVDRGLGDYVVDKVTKEQIFTRERGGHQTEKYSRCEEVFWLNGHCKRRYVSDKIDIQKTFGVDVLPPNWKPKGNA